MTTVNATRTAGFNVDFCLGRKQAGETWGVLATEAGVPVTTLRGMCRRSQGLARGGKPQGKCRPSERAMRVLRIHPEQAVASVAIAPAKPAQLTLTDVHRNLDVLADYLAIPPNGQPGAVWKTRSQDGIEESQPETPAEFSRRVLREWGDYCGKTAPKKWTYTQMLQYCFRSLGLTKGNVDSKVAAVIGTSHRQVVAGVIIETEYSAA